MLHAKEYEIIKTIEGVLVFKIKPCIKEPSNPILLYDGKNHATFYRNSEDVLLLDYINPEIQEEFIKSKEILVIEFDDVSKTVTRDYKALIKPIKKNPFTDGLK